jgi:hypothetical protein
MTKWGQLVNKILTEDKTDDFLFLTKEGSYLCLCSAQKLVHPSNKFGGWSGINYIGNHTFVIVSDRGYFMKYVVGNAALNSEYRILEFSQLIDENSAVLGERLTDAEEIIYDKFRDSFIIAFEQFQGRIVEYDSSMKLLAHFSLPDYMHGLPNNQKIEALAQFDEHSFITIAESVDQMWNSYGFVIDRSGDYFFYWYQSEQGYWVSSMATLPNRDFVVLERRFDFSKNQYFARLTYLERSEVYPDSVAKNYEIANIGYDAKLGMNQEFQVENFEGVAIDPISADACFIYLISDDNFNEAESTILMKFYFNFGQFSQDLDSAAGYCLGEESYFSAFYEAK